ncbi:MAG TPA: PAAR domain-containing protein [Longimicrobium sp.]
MTPAARVGDLHTCPSCTGPILSAGVPTVHVAGMPAAVAGSLCACAGPPDAIARGSPTVFIAGRAAARMGDPTVRGGVIVGGAPTVLIG